MMVKELFSLWMATMLVATAEITEEVDESNKTLTFIPDYPANITKLILHHNSITLNSTDVKTLSKFPNLTELDLSNNHIAELPSGAFSDLKNLEILSLGENKLQTIGNENFTGLKKLKKLDLQKNPLNCTCLFLSLIQLMKQSGLETNGSCAAPPDLANQDVMKVLDSCSSATKAPPVIITTAPAPTAAHTTSTATSTYTTSATTATTATTTTFTTTGQRTSLAPAPTFGNVNISLKDSLTEADKSGKQEPGVSNTWKFLVGVIVIALCTSMFIVCAIKSPSWYKLVFNYRHQRLRDVDEPNIFSTGRYSNFSLDTEQTETSAHELDQDPEQMQEDEDGFIEDRYIQPEDYKDQAEDYKDQAEDYKDNTEVYKDHADVDEV